jgi:hypothetical protein
MDGTGPHPVPKSETTTGKPKTARPAAGRSHRMVPCRMARRTLRGGHLTDRLQERLEESTGEKPVLVPKTETLEIDQRDFPFGESSGELISPNIIWNLSPGWSASKRILSVRTDDSADDDPCREISVNYREGTSTSRPRRPGS